MTGKRNAAMGRLFKFVAIFWLLCGVQLSEAEREIKLQVAEMSSVASVLTKLPQELKWPSTERRDYKILTGKEYVQVGQYDGVLKVRKQMDREKLCPDDREHCYVDVTVAVLPAGDRTSRTSIKVVKTQIEVIDINDNPPKFENPIIDKTMSEAVDVGTSIRLDSAVDPDFGSNSIQDYQLVSMSGPRSTDKYFELQTITNIDGTKIPKLRLKRPLDREKLGVHELMLEAFDGGTPALTGTATVRINITDSNDNVPKFDQEVYFVDINEHEEKGKVIIKVEARDKDVGSNGIIVYKFPSAVSAEDREIFALDPDTGAISIKNSEKLDFEARRLHHLTVEATDKGPNAVSAYTTVTVKVQDVNDNRPQVDISFMEMQSVLEASAGSDYDATIMEDIAVGQYIAFVTVTDRDGGNNGTVSCNIVKNGVFTLESIEKNTGRFLLKIESELDREIKSSYDLAIDAWDLGMPPQTSNRILKLQVGDVNDNPPEFYHDEFEAKVSETAAKGEVIAGFLQAKDSDESPGPNSNITYSLLKGRDFITKHERKYPLTKIFKIDPVSGEVRLAIGDILDAESVRNPGYLMVQAKDNGKPPLNSTTKLKITIVDENDNPPVFKQDSYVFRIDEHSNHGKFVGQVHATDADWSKDTNGKITYTIESYKLDNDRSISPEDTTLWLKMFQVEGKTGFIYFYGNRTKLDREVNSDRPITFSVVATDKGVKRQRATSTVKIFLSDINDNKPLVLFPDGRQDIAFVQIGQRKDSDDESGMLASSQALQSGSGQTWASVVTVYKETNQSDSFVPLSLAQVQATDKDEGQNAELSYAISQGDDNRYFQIDTRDGNLTFAEDVDFNTIKLGCHVLKVLVSDLGIPQLHSDAYVNLFLSRGGPNEMNVSDAMRECRTNPLFPRIIEDNVGIAGSEGMTLYISVGFGALICIILLIIAIVLVTKCRCCSCHKKSQSYNCQQSKAWNEAPGYDVDGKKLRKRSSRRSYNGQGTVDSRSSFHSQWTSSQTQMAPEKSEKVRVLPDLPSAGSAESHGIHDSGTGDSVSVTGDAYHPPIYTDATDPQDYLPNHETSYIHPQSSILPLQYGGRVVELPPQQMVSYVDHSNMYSRGMISPKCTNECIMYGHGDHCWMPDSLLRAQSQGPIDMMPGGNPDLVIYQNHPGELRYLNDPSTPYYYDPGQKFSHLSSNEGSDHLSYTKSHPDSGFRHPGAGDGMQSHPSFQHQPIHAPSPHPLQMRYGNEADAERAYINLQGYDPGQSQPEEMHSNLSSASSNANPYGAALPQNNQWYRSDAAHPQMYYPNPNSSRYDMVPTTTQGYIPSMHDPGHPTLYAEDYSASNLLLPNGPADYSQHWDHGMAMPAEHQPLINRSGRTSNPVLDESKSPSKNVEALVPSASAVSSDGAQAQSISKDEKLSTIQEQDSNPAPFETDDMLL